MAQTEYTGMQKAGDATYMPGEPNSQNAVIITQPSQPKSSTEPTIQERPSAVLPIVFSCLVYWCCCPVFGLIAFICAIYAGTKEDHREYREKLSLSKKLSLVGLIVGIILIIISVISSLVRG